MRKIFYFVLLSCLLTSCFSRVFGSDPADTTTVKNKRYLLLPLAFRTPETGWGFVLFSGIYFKAKKNDPNLRTSDVTIGLVYTLKNQYIVILNSAIYFSKENNILRTQGTWSIIPDKFWGLGNNSPDSIMENYTMNQANIHFQYLHKASNAFYAGLSYDFQHIEPLTYTEGGEFDQENIYNRDGGMVSGLGCLFTYDNRNNAFCPDKGLFAELNLAAFNKILGSTVNFYSATLDVRKFFHLSSTTVLGLQSYMRLNNGDVSFRNLGFLGGQDIMRGYYRGRYCDNNYMAYQAELRQHLFWRLGATGFFSIGEVSSKVNYFSLPGLHYTYGGGLRVMLKEKDKLNLRIDYGIGKETQGLYVVLKEAF